MKVLSINCGSSSLELRLLEIDADGAASLWEGAVEAIGPDAVVALQTPGEPLVRNSEAIGDYGVALNVLLGLLGEERRRAIDAVGHRVVHGGALTEPAIINDEILEAIDAARRFASLHNGPSLEGIRAAQQARGRRRSAASVTSLLQRSASPRRPARVARIESEVGER